MVSRLTGSKFVSGRNEDGLVYLNRADGSVARCGVVIIRGASVTDNGDATADIVFDGS